MTRKMIIGLSGRAGAGKSTAARLLQEEMGFTVLPFAGPLKEMAVIAGFCPGQVYGDRKEEPLASPLPRIDHEAARSMLRALPMHCFRHAASAKQIKRVTNVEFETACSTLIQFDEHHHHEFTTPRRFLQLLGTEWGREMIGTDFWAEVWLGALMESAAEHFGDILAVADDCRFANEASAVRSEGGVVVRIIRPGDGSASGADHASERMDFEPDITIWNDGPEDVLRARMLGVLERYWSSEAI